MKSTFVDKLVSRMDKLDATGLQDQLLGLARHRGLLDTILRQIQEAVLVVSADGNVTYANRSAETMLGFELSRLRGHPIERHLPGIDWAALARRDEKAWESLSSSEIELYRPQRRILSLYAFPLEEGENTQPGVVAILRDVTREREDAAAALESERMQAVSVLAASLAHEIGNPLNAIGLNLQLLRREMKNIPDEERRADLSELVDSAYGEVSRLDLILKKFLRALRPSAPALAPCDVLHELEESLKVMKADIEAHRVSVTVDHPESLPKIQGDGEQLRQVFFNLVKNSVQAMADGGTLAIALSADDRDLTVAFRDSGEGIPKEDFQQLFQPFHTTKPHGHGIGLAIVQRIVQDHGGRIDVSSKPGEGTCFRLVFPLADRRVRRLAAPQ